MNWQAEGSAEGVNWQVEGNREGVNWQAEGSRAARREDEEEEI